MQPRNTHRMRLLAWLWLAAMLAGSVGHPLAHALAPRDGVCGAAHLVESHHPAEAGQGAELATWLEAAPAPAPGENPCGLCAMLGGGADGPAHGQPCIHSAWKPSRLRCDSASPRALLLCFDTGSRAPPLS